jgi:hypothetical protein
MLSVLKTSEGRDAAANFFLTFPAIAYSSIIKSLAGQTIEPKKYIHHPGEITERALVLVHGMGGVVA